MFGGDKKKRRAKIDYNYIELEGKHFVQAERGTKGGLFFVEGVNGQYYSHKTEGVFFFDQLTNMVVGNVSSIFLYLDNTTAWLGVGGNGQIDITYSVFKPIGTDRVKGLKEIASWAVNMSIVFGDGKVHFSSRHQATLDELEKLLPTGSIKIPYNKVKGYINNCLPARSSMWRATSGGILASVFLGTILVAYTASTLFNGAISINNKESRAVQSQIAELKSEIVNKEADIADVSLYFDDKKKTIYPKTNSKNLMVDWIEDGGVGIPSVYNGKYIKRTSVFTTKPESEEDSNDD